jgi:hypothetical protein
MRVIIAGLLALLLGMVGGAFVRGTQVKNELVAAAADSAARAHAADSVVAEHVPTEHAATEEHGAHDPAATSVVTDAVPPSDPVDGDPEVTDPAPILAAEESAVADSAAIWLQQADEGARKLAKIFGSMEPEDAADVLQELDDQEIEMILHHMSDRVAAQVLEAFEPARAASLSRVVLGSDRAGT